MRKDTSLFKIKKKHVEEISNRIFLVTHVAKNSSGSFSRVSVFLSPSSPKRFNGVTFIWAETWVLGAKAVVVVAMMHKTTAMKIGATCFIVLSVFCI